MPKNIILWATLVAACALPSAIRAQEGAPSPAQSDLSMRLENVSAQPSGSETAAPQAPATEDEGFWIWPHPVAKSGNLCTDRPGFSDAVCVVLRGQIQLETGYSFTYDKENETRTKNHLLGEFSLRNGLVENFELRLKWAGFSMTESHFEGSSRFSGRNIMQTDHEDGATDMSIGFKSQLLKQDGLIPNLSIIPAISIPTGTNSKSTGDVDPEIRLAWNYSLSEKLTVYGVGLATWLTDGEEHRFFQSGASLAAFYQFTPKLGGFVEYYGLYPSTRDGDCQHNIDFGPVILVNENFQIDIRVGVGLNEEAPDFQAGIGACYRF